MPVVYTFWFLVSVWRSSEHKTVGSDFTDLIRAWSGFILPALRRCDPENCDPKNALIFFDSMACIRLLRGINNPLAAH